MQVRTTPTNSTYVACCGEVGVSRYELRKPVESSLPTESDEEEVDVGNTDMDMDWDKVTDDDANAEYLYCQGLFSDNHETDN
jgi:hypothetical protein